MCGTEASLFFLSVLMTGRCDYCPKLRGESIAPGERLRDVSWRCLLAEKMNWNNVVVCLIDGNSPRY